MIFPLYGAEQISKVYPELEEFFASEKLKDALGSTQIEIQKTDKNTLIGKAEYGLGKNGFYKKIIFSNALIDSVKLSAPEFQFIVCHELGHFNDPNILTHYFVPQTALFGSLAVFALKCGYAFKKRKLPSAVSLARVGLVGLGSFMVKQHLARQGEYFADNYALAMTGNLDAAVSMLQKRKVFHNNTTTGIVAWCKEWFADHPTEEKRITNLSSKP